MKRTVIAVIIAVAFSCSNLYARTIIIKINNVRSDNGNILVMAQADKESQPVYGKAKAANGEVTITLENVTWDRFDLSVFHDENDNHQMDFTENKRPVEAYAMKNCQPGQEEEIVKLKLFYPPTE